MKTITKNIYTFDELSDAAKETARDWYRECASHDEWWESTYDDAERAGLKITSFDLDRNRHATGEFIRSAVDCAERIVADHGKDCETYKTASAHLKAGEAVEDSFSDDASEKIEELEADFLKSILEDYSISLQREYEYLYSDECVDETIKINGYEFDEEGNRA
jgi:hypothetical protein